MSHIVIGAAASHSTLMNTHWDAVEHLGRATRFRDSLSDANRAIIAAKPDCAVIIGSNHFRGMYLDLVPTFTIGVGECIASGESGTPAGPQDVDTVLALHIADAMMNSGFDPAFSARLQVDHGITHAIQYLLKDLAIPVIPVVVNVFAPPLPQMRRCHDFGSALRNAIDSFPSGRRVALIASGGLSHRLPWPDWRVPSNDDEDFLVEAWLNGRTNWKDYEARRREIVLKASRIANSHSPISPDFDRAFLSALGRQELAPYLDLSTLDLQEQAGNGGQEIRSWIIAAAACAEFRPKVLSYEELPEWLTGMGAVLFEA